MKTSDAKSYNLSPLIIESLIQNNIDNFTTVQSEAIKSGLCSGESLVISAPTSTGKTTIAEIAAVEGALKGKRTVYLVTHKALAEEKYQVFKQKYCQKENTWFNVSISTGDYSEGDWQDGILVATYEKYLSLLCSSKSYYLMDKIVIADEIQILSDLTRGADIEILCAIIKKQKPFQFVALSATAPNAEELSDWLNCKFVSVLTRDIDLLEEIWYGNKIYQKYFGSDDTSERINELKTTTTLNVVDNLLSNNYAPILVFTMTKRQAVKLAEQFSKTRAQDVNSYSLSDQLELFSEPTTLSRTLKIMSEKRIAFHSADLTFQERVVVESALREKSLDVVFSTPTLASGVNLPIRTVVFDSYKRHWLQKNPWLTKAEYLNMSGRAGRLGLHDEGTSILLPENKVDFEMAKNFLLSEQQPINSTLIQKSIRKNILGLIAIKICNDQKGLEEFFHSTFWYHQTLNNNVKLLEKLKPKIQESIKWLELKELIKIKNNKYYPTQLGNTIFSTGLLPSTGSWLISKIKNNLDIFDSDKFDLAIVHLICASDEFDDEFGQRFLPYAIYNQPEMNAYSTLHNIKTFIDPDIGKNCDKIINAAYGTYLWCNGYKEHELKMEISPISYGNFFSLSSDIAWILEGLVKIMKVPEVGISNSIITKIEVLSERVRFGVPSQLIDLMKAAKVSNVPGFGRHRAMELLKHGLDDPNKLIRENPKTLSKVLEQHNRAELLIEAVSNYYPNLLIRWKDKHIRVTQNLEKDVNLVKNSYEDIGEKYEDSIEQILNIFGWDIKKLDSNKRQGVPDFLINHNGFSIIFECKTKTNENAMLGKEEAFAVLTKGVDINADHCITLGKPDFGTFSKEKAAGSQKITLLPHYCLIDALLLFWSKQVSSEKLFEWLKFPGVASIDKLLLLQ